MTDIKVTVPETAHGRRVATALLTLVALLVGRLAQAHRERRDIEHLMKLDDCYLKDIGIARCEIEAVVRRVEKIETAIEPRFQEHFIEAMGIPHKSAPFPHLSAAVTLPQRAHKASGDASKRRRRVRI